jgi:purine-binding chemotaxis protein CheW
MADDTPLDANVADELAAIFDEPSPPAATAACAAPSGAVRPDVGSTAVEDGRGLEDILAAIDAGASADDAVQAAVAAAPARHAGARVVSFAAGGAHYGVRVPEVVEVGRIPAITHVPNMPAWVRGVTNLRGDVVSVIDLGAFCGSEPTPLGSGRMLVARQPDDDLTIGILVERVHEITFVTPEQVTQASAPITGTLAPFLRGVYTRGDRLLAMLDLDALLRSPDIRQFEDVHDV